MVLGWLVTAKKSEVSFRKISRIWGDKKFLVLVVFSLLGVISVCLLDKGIDGQMEVSVCKVDFLSVGLVLCCRCFNVVLPTVCLSLM